MAVLHEVVRPHGIGEILYLFQADESFEATAPILEDMGDRYIVGDPIDPRAQRATFVKACEAVATRIPRRRPGA